MLQLKNITKNYVTGDSTVQALKGVNVSFRQNEFVSILGPSGCGKTTLLNIIGGLDQYTSGDLIIKGRSTKNYNDRDWDSYRNHSIGFVFQSYNLIPHQTVLGNVELALTLSGVSKNERRKRAIDALNEVGLGDQINKKPNQLSGGQMQRVAIARALVNNPNIILADEPTGALDTETSIQVMEILKKVAQSRLVVMVTHNPELAEKYSTRIVKLLDGTVIDDSNPYTEVEDQPQEQPKEKAKKNKKEKTSMSFLTALSLSLHNMFTKKARTLLTAFAGSIGIIGIALVLSLSNGFQTYINKVEEDTLSTYPLSIERTNVDLTSMMEAIGTSNSNKEKHDDDAAHSNDVLTKMLSSMLSAGVKQNDLKSFRAYIEEHREELEPYVSSIAYSYNAQINVFKEETNTLGETDVRQLIPYTIPNEMLSMMTNELHMPQSAAQQMITMMQQITIWQEMLDNQKLLDSQYDVLKGNWPTKADEAVLVVDENNEINDYVLYALGLLDYNYLMEILPHIKDPSFKPTSWQMDFDDLIGLTYHIVPNSSLYKKNNNVWECQWSTSNNGADNTDKAKNEFIRNVISDNTKSIDVKIVGIIRLKENAQAGSINGAIGYTKELTEYIMNVNNQSEIVKEQENNPTINVLTGQPITDPYQLVTNLTAFGKADLEDPSAIRIYPSSFDGKEYIIDFIENYNKQQTDDDSKIQYTDLVGLMMESVSVIIDAIAYVLIAFVSISLVVSSIMIGIITYISVLERTKEIGVLRSIGASKRDISRVFNAETLIIGFAAGLLGIIVTVILDIPVNILLNALAGIGNIAKLPILGAIILILISMFLTFIAGLIPASIAAKKDPVIALRTE